ncbi:hypothetical protein [Spiroplasma sp. BIUS-1]|uniref:hypothetical protein n=1 Tax=Spiroplasma sp. BIUS-1 TaxID=216964 RepID=UPI001396E995|nr:hypothetical protein [Spiroplasma sp. BIUS-1]QHX36723.1 hypothetical protein SBIUS_v1c04700 [Spiroplasma sp. BIUS-1]
MNSIYRNIDNLGRENRNTVFKIISKQILSDFSNGVFLSQDDLAMKCNCSKSTITAFSKAVLVSGYRELQIRLKIEYENNFEINNNQKIYNQKNKENFLDTTNNNLKNFILKNHEKILKFISKDNKIINIFSSYQTNFSTIFLKDVLDENKITSNVINLEKDVLTLKNINLESCKSLFIFSGRDNSFLKKFLDYINLSKEDIIVISSLQWKEYLDSKKVEVIYFDNENFKRNYIDRNFILIYMWKYLDYLLKF